MSEIDYAAALRAGDAVRGTTSPNPPVGCALFSPDGALIATGGTSPAGGAHAEINALRAAGDRARGATAVVTLEPCNHTGRTGPCSQALVDAHITRLVYLTKDPNPQAAGGADYLERHGVEVIYALQRVDALQPWLTSVARGRPSVTLKYAASLDGLTAAPDGTSKWITGEDARRHVHADRAVRDAIVVGTGTAIADNPSLTARRGDGTLMETQPRRVVVGTRAVPEETSHGSASSSTPPPPRRWRRCGSRARATCSWKAGRGWRRAFFERASSTGSRPTWPRCCSAPARAWSTPRLLQPWPTRRALPFRASRCWVATYS